MAVYDVRCSPQTQVGLSSEIQASTFVHALQVSFFKLLNTEPVKNQKGVSTEHKEVTEEALSLF